MTKIGGIRVAGLSWLPSHGPSHGPSRGPSRGKLPPVDARLTPAERLAFYIKVDPLSGCHLWHGSINHAGYGKLNIRNKSWAAHRLAWMLKHGAIPPGMILCHRCDVRRCVNPDHLVLGTRGDNMADHKAKRLAVHAARAATGPDSARIYILYRGLELSGDVEARMLGLLPPVGDKKSA